ncbi:hypothetical protein BU24DRAFT_426883 [Aaosphaeria arxii CBS 175.79]|uniref:Uncharacterized protein n=1 Tax=Aaosphaeria arxii CBS 175.79 TaxID=1450172 RepID=A0A6A5XG27_9PLEO|nr:uncharacterized protein BU24DRAFT_426883 [Aaosphaeria arxii CBS 175.79]KAF2011787.1 hypothetical protein BU24DRAFT_426883 [Aaosphaeria arxii CBS 175.79]
MAWRPPATVRGSTMDLLVSSTLPIIASSVLRPRYSVLRPVIDQRKVFHSFHGHVGIPLPSAFESMYEVLSPLTMASRVITSLDWHVARLSTTNNRVL